MDTFQTKFMCIYVSLANLFPLFVSTQRKLQILNIQTLPWDSITLHDYIRLNKIAVSKYGSEFKVALAGLFLVFHFQFEQIYIILDIDTSNQFTLI